MARGVGGEKKPGGATARVTIGDVRGWSHVGVGGGALSLARGERKSRGMANCIEYRVWSIEYVSGVLILLVVKA